MSSHPSTETMQSEIHSFIISVLDGSDQTFGVLEQQSKGDKVQV